MKNESKQSEFNYAVSYLERINYLFYEVAKAKLNLEYFNWCNLVSQLFSEVSDELDEDEYEKKKKLLKDLFDYFYLLNDKSSPKVDQDKYWQLFDFEHYIRRVIKDHGLKTRYKEDIMTPEYDWDNADFDSDNAEGEEDEQ